jgi:hypothetical protein
MRWFMRGIAGVAVLAGVALVSAHFAVSRFQSPAKTSGAILHEERTMTLALAGAPETVFPLFGPVCEGVWASGWQPEFLHPKSGGTGEGAVFTTGGPHGTQAIWILSAYDVQRRELQYVQVIPGMMVTELLIQVREGPNKNSAVSVTHRWTTLSPLGETILAHHLKEFSEEGPHWEKAINLVLAQGRSCAQATRVTP